MGVRRELAVTVISAHNLKNAKHGFRRMNPYAVVWIDSNSKAATHVAEKGGRNPSWNCTIRMLCRENLFGTLAKAKLVVEIFDHDRKKSVGYAHVLLSELKSGMVWGCSPGCLSEPKRMSLEVRVLRKLQNFDDKVIGSVDIEVRLGRSVDGDHSDSIHEEVPYNGIQMKPHDLEMNNQMTQNLTFNESLPEPIPPVQKTGELAPLYYQYRYVEKPKPVWRCLGDPKRPGTLLVAALTIC